MRVLLVSSEIHPLAKTGGLADVCGALPRALAGLGADVRFLMPAYESALDRLGGPRSSLELGEMFGIEGLRLVGGAMPDSGLPVWLLDCPALYRRPGTPYQNAEAGDWPDNWLRFGLLAHVAARTARVPAPFDAVHCHDWQTGLAPYFLAASGGERPRTVFTPKR